jgi:hypothetical protein
MSRRLHLAEARGDVSESLRCACVNGPNRSTVGRELALRPGFLSPSPNATNGASAPRGERRGLLVF